MVEFRRSLDTYRPLSDRIWIENILLDWSRLSLVELRYFVLFRFKYRWIVTEYGVLII